MTATFRLPAEELDQSFVERLKAMYREKQIAIVVYEEDETDYLMSTRSNREHLDQSIENIRQGKNLTEVGKNGKRRFQSVEEALAQFSPPTLDTRGWKFNRDEANER
jgi:antitoxin YefM